MFTSKLDEKSIEDLNACKLKIEEELQKKRDEETLKNGGFVCRKCGGIFRKDREHRKYVGWCYSCGYDLDVARLKTIFPLLVTPEAFADSEVVFMNYLTRDYNKDGTKVDGKPEPLTDGTSLVIGTLILKLGNYYAEIVADAEEDYGYCHSLLHLILHENPPKVKDGYVVWGD